jgi:hypothetical protein
MGMSIVTTAASGSDAARSATVVEKWLRTKPSSSRTTPTQPAPDLALPEPFFALSIPSTAHAHVLHAPTS